MNMRKGPRVARRRLFRRYMMKRKRRRADSARNMPTPMAAPRPMIALLVVDLPVVDGLAVNGPS